MKETRIISFVNQKGGVAKTTSVACIGVYLANCGYSVLMIDMDPQGNLSTSLGMRPGADEVTTYEVLKGADINEAITTGEGNKPYDLVPADIRLSKADLELAGVPGRDFLLKEALSGLEKHYDFILIDNAPSLNILTLMALTASNEVIVPVKADYLALDGLAQLRDTVDLVKRRLNPGLDTTGVFLTFYDDRRTLDKEVEASLKKAFHVFNSHIPTNTKLAEAPSYGQDIYTYNAESKGAKQYASLTDEILLIK